MNDRLKPILSSLTGLALSLIIVLGALHLTINSFSVYSILLSKLTWTISNALISLLERWILLCNQFQLFEVAHPIQREILVNFMLLVVSVIPCDTFYISCSCKCFSLRHFSIWGSKIPPVCHTLLLPLLHLKSIGDNLQLPFSWNLQFLGAKLVNIHELDCWSSIYSVIIHDFFQVIFTRRCFLDDLYQQSLYVFYLKCQ